jgi:hypothetical protein
MMNNFVLLSLFIIMSNLFLLPLYIFPIVSRMPWLHNNFLAGVGHIQKPVLVLALLVQFRLADG